MTLMAGGGVYRLKKGDVLNRIAYDGVIVKHFHYLCKQRNQPTYV